MAGEAQRGSSWFGVVLTGMEGSSKAGWDWQSAEWIVEVRLGRHGSLSYVVVGQGRHGWSLNGWDRMGGAGSLRRGQARSSKVWTGLARQAWEGGARL